MGWPVPVETVRVRSPADPSTKRTSDVTPIDPPTFPRRAATRQHAKNRDATLPAVTNEPETAFATELDLADQAARQVGGMLRSLDRAAPPRPAPRQAGPPPRPGGPPRPGPR